VLGNPIYRGALVSNDARTTALLVYFHELSDSAFPPILDEIEQIAGEEAHGAEVWLTGTPRVKVETNRIVVRSAARTLPLILAVLAVVLLISFGTLRGVLVPVLTIVISLVYTLGFVARFGGSLNLVTVLVPPLLMTLGVSYAIHVVAEYYQALRRARAEGDHRERVAEALHEVMLPVVLTGITTAIGFASLMLSPLGAIRDFGLYSVVGVAVTSLTALVFAPALLVALGRPRRIARQREEGAFDRFAEKLAHFDLSHRRAIFVAFALVFAVAIYGVTQIRVGTDHISKFRPEAPVRADFEAINEHLDGANPFYVVLQTDYTDAFKEPVNLLELERLQDWLEAQPEIGGTSSLVDYVKLINRGFHENDPNHLAIPESRMLTSQLLFFGANEEIERYADSRFQIANVMVRAKVIDSDEVAALVQRIQRRLSELPERFESRITGNPVLLNRTIDDIMRGQARSMIAALAVIYAVLAAMFVSLRVGLIALVPNMLPIAAYFGALGLFGINLAPGTSLVAPMALGIAVDDTIHYFARFNRDAKRLANDRLATISALRGVGRAVTYTSLTLVLGFLMLTASELRTQVEVGLMAAFALGFAWLTDFTLTPALCAGLRIATLWDALTLDLGPEPQNSIPLLRGLTTAQARIVALMSSILTVPAGQRLIRTGEQGREMYVVIDGTLRAWTQKDGRDVELNRHERGDVVGEVGLFYHERTANVDALTDARLLRISQSSLQRLARRYPRYAARVHQNLNKILADRLARLTERVR
jgi:predicted RND superfamily exporter protein